jgi:hypothetical protein
VSHLSGGRDPAFEREFLRQAERLAGMTNSGYVEEVAARLHRAEREKGPDSYLSLGMRKLANEIGEEALDIGGWSTVAALSAYPQVADVERRHQVHLLLQGIAAHGPLLWELCRQLRDLLDD